MTKVSKTSLKTDSFLCGTVIFMRRRQLLFSSSGLSMLSGHSDLTMKAESSKLDGL